MRVPGQMRERAGNPLRYVVHARLMQIYTNRNIPDCKRWLFLYRYLILSNCDIYSFTVLNGNAKQLRSKPSVAIQLPSCVLVAKQIGKARLLPNF